MTSVPQQTDFIVIGAGVAGLRAAIGLASAGRVLVLAKKEVSESNTQYAQGGIAVALSDEDEIGLHLQDTLTAGDGLCNVAAATVLVEEGPIRIEELIAWGTEFDRAGARLAFTREGAHSRSRVLHAHGDSTGREIGRALWEKAKTLKHISISEFEFTTDLIVEDDRVVGVALIDDKGAIRRVHAKAVLLATGGLGCVYSNTTNPDVATGDGVAMGFRAGAEISDMEFVQFHPTALYLKDAPRFLLSEALRGEGAYLRNGELDRFMLKYHPLGELAPRDVVARAIAHELEISRAKDHAVFLDMTHLRSKHLDKRFPRIYETCLKYNLDITCDLIPIRPAAHYAMGGVRTDLDGRTNIDGLYAAGEVACTGVHGANRLASNSLLEGLVFGARAAHAMREDVKDGGVTTKVNNPTLRCAKDGAPSTPYKSEAKVPESKAALESAEACIRQVRELMWRQAGIVRTAQGLKCAIDELERLAPTLPDAMLRRCCEARNIHQTGLLVARSALARLESRGAHYRTDYPAHNDTKFLKHTVIQGDKVWFE
jgi:L-aspartate oxidase